MIGNRIVRANALERSKVRGMLSHIALFPLHVHQEVNGYLAQSSRDTVWQGKELAIPPHNIMAHDSTILIKFSPMLILSIWTALLSQNGM